MNLKLAITGMAFSNDAFRNLALFDRALYDGCIDNSSLNSQVCNTLILINEVLINEVLDNEFFGISKTLESYSKTAFIITDDSVQYTGHSENLFQVSGLPFPSILLKAHELLEGNAFESFVLASSTCALELKSFTYAKENKDRIYSVLETFTSDDFYTISQDKKADQIDFFEVTGEETDLNRTGPYKNALDFFQKNTEKRSCALGFSGDPLISLLKISLSLSGRYIPSIQGIVTKIHEEHLEESLKHTSIYLPWKSKTWFKSSEINTRTAIITSRNDSSHFDLIITDNGCTNDNDLHYIKHTEPLMITLSGNSEETLKAKLEHLHIELSTPSDLIKLSSEAFNESKINPKDQYALVIVGNTRERLMKECLFLKQSLKKSFSENQDLVTPSGSYFTPDPLGRTGKIVFSYPGVASAYTDIGRDLLRLFPQIFDMLTDFMGKPGEYIHEELIYPGTLEKPSDDKQKVRDKNLRNDIMKISECGISFSFIYTAIMTLVFGIKPDCALGYSMGEASMMASLMVWKNPMELAGRFKENQIFKSGLTGRLETVRKAWKKPFNETESSSKIWDAYTLKTSASVVRNVLTDENKVFITLINTDDEVVIAGDPTQCSRIINKIGCDSFPLNLDLAIHSGPAYGEYENMVNLYSLETNDIKDIKFYSSSCYLPVPIRKKSVGHCIAKAFCDTVDYPRLVRKVYDDGGRIFIETGPRQTCSLWTEKILKGKRHVTIPLDVKGVKDSNTIKAAVAKLISHRVDMNLECLYK